MQIPTLTLLVALAAGPVQGQLAEDPAAKGVRLTHCLVSAIDDVLVPAQEAGVLVSLAAIEGMWVETGAELARINGNQAQLQRRVAAAERQVAQIRADSDVDIRYAQAAQRVADSEYRQNVAANERVPGTKTAIELQKLLLSLEQMTLALEQSEHQQQVAKVETEAYTARVELADDQIDRRLVKAPLDGQVVEVYFRPGEWVQPGEQLLRIVRLDRLRVEGFLSASEYLPAEVDGCSVQVVIHLPQGRLETFTGRIVFVSPLVQAGGAYRVWAEVVNRRENNHWLLRPGLEAEMVIDVACGPRMTGEG